MRFEDPDPCPTSLIMSYEMKTPGRRCLPEGCLGSRVDAPQKPNCRSPVQGLERQGLRRHLPSRSSVRAELRDGNTHTCGWTVILKVFCSCVPSDRRSPYLTFHGGKLKEKGLACGTPRDRQLIGFNPELKLPRLMSAKN
jgi:hypothetical protein